ncbi:MAG: ABC transporter permease, partial [Betaproteobacteria bacterium]|nr:ABC transporter permease [Betaproteobacteria bacterium]
MKGRERLLSILSPLLLLGAWELSVRAGLVDRRFIAAPSIILIALWDMLASGELARHVGASLWRIVAGFTIGVVP